MPVTASCMFDGNLDKARVFPYVKAENFIYRRDISFKILIPSTFASTLNCCLVPVDGMI